VAQIVEPGARRQAGPAHGPGPRLAEAVLGDGDAVFAGDEEIGRGGIAALETPSELGEDRIGQGDGPHGGLRFRDSDRRHPPDGHGLLGDRELASREVDPADRHPESFAHSKAGAGSQDYQRPVERTNGVRQGLHLLERQGLDATLCNLGQPDVGGDGGVGHDPVSDGRAEDRRENRMDASHAPR